MPRSGSAPRGRRRAARIVWDADREGFRIGRSVFRIGDDGPFDVLASQAATVKLSDLPPRVHVLVCDPIHGSNDLTPRAPACTLERVGRGRYVAHCEAAFFLPDVATQADAAARLRNLADQVSVARRRLAQMRPATRISDVAESVHDDIAYLNFDLTLPDQSLVDALAFVEALEQRLRDGLDGPKLFVCHASEDKAFVRRLVRELDRRALYAWFDEREILVGDSIVGEVSAAIGRVRYLVAVLSRESVVKPWVQRELNAALMRQLRDGGVTVLPVRLDDCEVPPLLCDIRYADFRRSFQVGLADVLDAIRLDEPGAS